MLSEQHRQYLLDHAVSAEIIDATRIDSDGEWILFPWVGLDGEVTIQRKRYVPGEKTGYLWETGKPLHPWVLRELDDEGPLLITEGTKQSLAAASWAPPEFSVYGMAGCRGFSKVDLAFAEDRDVFIILDADASSNHDVYDAGDKLRIRLTDEDARVKFVRLPVEEKEGLDDYLSGVRSDKRTNRMARRISEAVSKPADRKPMAKPGATPQRVAADMPETGGRDMVAVNGDLKAVVDNVLGAMKRRWDGHFLFNYGEAITGVEGANTVPVEGGAFLRLLAETCFLVVHHPATQRSPERFEPGGRIDKHTHEAVLAAAREFTALERVVRAPFVRPDGTICTAAGYDAPTKTLLIPDDSLGTVLVPETPTAEELRAAVQLVMDDWLSDMPFPTAKDRANALALLITPFVRGLFELAPLAVVSGLQMGVGKNLFADCVAILATGKAAVPLPYTQGNDDETRKQITSAFRSGAELFCFDEAHEIEGAQLARALTSVTYTDRILGRSEMAEFPNRVTWMALGNQVKVEGDVSRRVYWIELKPAGANPQDRDANLFRHPALRDWTHENRTRLVVAVLTIIRAWFVAGQPSTPRGSTLGSFEGWDRVVGGIVSHAGQDGFLSDIVVKRSETDFDSSYWAAHIVWLFEMFGTESFYTSEVREKALYDPADYEAPPGMEDPSDKNYARKLGQKYATKADRWYEGKRLVKAGIGHKKRLKWTIETTGEDQDGGLEGTGGNVPTPCTRVKSEITSSGHVKTHMLGGETVPAVPSSSLQYSPSPVGGTIAFDLETCSADELHRRPDFVRLSAATGLPPTTSPEELISHLNRAGKITGHNILGFDLLALAKHHGADFEALAEKSVDTMIVAKQLDPPLSKGMPSGYYSLNTLSERLGVTGKVDEIARLARKHGGYDQIPQDDPEYVEYLEGDVRASEAVLEALGEGDAYTQREHRVQAIMGRVSLNGFRVDEELVWDRHQRGQDRLDGMRDVLHRDYGFPAEGKAPQRTNVGKEAFYNALVGQGVPARWLDAKWEKNQDGTLAMAKEVLQEKLEFLSQHAPGAAAVVETIMDMNGVRSVYGNCIDWCVDGRVHPEILPEQASGRWSVRKPGLTVMGKRNGKHVEREIYLPEPGHVLVAFDLDQVDMRAIAGHCQDRAYMALFAPGEDVHSAVAAMVGLTREQAKVIGHGWNYGLGIEGQVRNGVEREAAVRFDEGMKRNFPRLGEWKEEVREIAKAGLLLDNGFGRKMRVHPSSYYTQGPAAMGQGTTRDIIAEGLLRLPKTVIPMVRVIVHDEVVLSIPRDSLTDVSNVVREAMTFEFKGVPITCGQSKAGVNWGDCYAK